MKRVFPKQTWQEANAWPGLDTGGMTLDEIRRKVRGTPPLRVVRQPEHVGEVLHRLKIGESE